MADMPHLARTSPEAQGVSSPALLDLIDALDRTISEMHSLVLLRHGQVVAEGWWAPYGPEIPHMLFSLTKSFTSTAIGLAVAEGRLAVDDPVLKFFPEKAPRRVSRNLAAMRVRHLLSMSTGHKQDATERAVAQAEGDWVKGFLAAPVEHAPGKHQRTIPQVGRCVGVVAQHRHDVPRFQHRPDAAPDGLRTVSDDDVDGEPDLVCDIFEQLAQADRLAL